MPQKKQIINRTSMYRNIAIASIFLIVLAVWQAYISFNILSLPSDFSFSANIISVDNLYNEEAGRFSGGIYSQTEYEYKTVASDGHYSIIEHTFNVRSPEDEPIFSVRRQYGVNRLTGGHVAGLGDKERNGYLFGPQNVNPNDTFTYWHINYDAPAKMTFDRSEIINGLETYVFTGSYENNRIDQTKELSNLPDVGTTRGIELEPTLYIWLEPHTGQLVKYEDDTIAYYYDLETGIRQNPWNHFSNRFDESSIEEATALARFERTKARLVEAYIPIILIALMLFFVGRAFGFIQYLKRKLTTPRLMTVVGTISIIVAGLSLLGWLSGYSLLTSIATDTSAMNPVTALCFIILGTALLLKDRGWEIFTASAGLVLILIAGLRIAGLIGLISFDIDLLLFTDAIQNSASPARMAEFTTLSFFALGVVLLSIYQEKIRSLRIVEVFTTLVFIASLLALEGYLFDISDLLSVPLFFSTSIQTAILLGLVSAVMYFSFREQDYSSITFKNWLLVSGILLGTVIITVSVAASFERIITREARGVFESRIDQATEAIADRLGIYINAVEGGAGLFAASGSVERNQWKPYVDALKIKNNYAGIQALGFLDIVALEEVDEHVATVRADGFPEYRIFPDGIRDTYMPVLYVEPFDEQNALSLGFDMYQEPIRRISIEQTRDSGESRLSDKITLIQESAGSDEPGFLIFSPYYTNESSIETIEERRNQIQGFVYAAFRAKDFIAGAITHEVLSNIAMRINSGTSLDDETLLYDDHGTIVGANETPRFIETRTIYVAGRPWTLSFTSTPDFEQSSFSRFIPYLITIIGLIISFLIAIVFYTFATSRQRAEHLAVEVTEDLRKSRDELAKALDKSKERQEELETLNKVMVGRELKMIELKEKISEMKKRDEREQ